MRSFHEIEKVYAGFWARLAAYFMDICIVFLLQLAARFALFLMFGLLFSHNPLDAAFLFQYSVKDALLYGVGALYFVLCTYCAGATLGKKAMNLRVISADRQKLTLLNIIFRETVGRFLSGFILGIGYMLAGVTGEKTALHDMLCDTRVIYAKKIPTYVNGDINARYTHYVRENSEKDGATAFRQSQGDFRQEEKKRKEPEPFPYETQGGHTNRGLYEQYIHIDPKKQNGNEEK